MAKATTTEGKIIEFNMGRHFHGVGFTYLEISLEEMEDMINTIGPEKAFQYLKCDIFTRMIHPHKVMLV